MDIKIYETRSRGVRCKLPMQLLVHCAKRKSDVTAHKLANKYLGANFKSKLGHFIGICTLTNTVKMTPKLIQAQPAQGLELGIWQPNRVAWQAIDKKLFDTPIPATGKQSAPWKIDEDLINHINLNELLQQF